MLLSKLKKKTANQFIKSSQLFFLESLYRNFPSVENVVTNYIRSFLKGSPTSRLQYWSWKLNIWMIQVSRKILRQAVAYRNIQGPKYQTKSLSQDKLAAHDATFISRVSETKNVAIWPSSYQFQVNESTSGGLSALVSTFDTSFIGLQEKTKWMKVETSLKSFGATYKLNFILTRTYATGPKGTNSHSSFFIASLGICHAKPQRSWLWHSRRPEIPAFWQPVISSPDQSPVILKQNRFEAAFMICKKYWHHEFPKKTWQSVCVFSKSKSKIWFHWQQSSWLQYDSQVPPQKKESFPKQRPQAQKTAPGSP